MPAVTRTPDEQAIIATLDSCDNVVNDGLKPLGAILDDPKVDKASKDMFGIKTVNVLDPDKIQLLMDAADAWNKTDKDLKTVDSNKFLKTATDHMKAVATSYECLVEAKKHLEEVSQPGKKLDGLITKDKFEALTKAIEKSNAAITSTNLVLDKTRLNAAVAAFEDISKQKGMDQHTCPM